MYGITSASITSKRTTKRRFQLWSLFRWGGSPTSTSYRTAIPRFRAVVRRTMTLSHWNLRQCRGEVWVFFAVGCTGTVSHDGRGL